MQYTNKQRFERIHKHFRELLETLLEFINDPERVREVAKRQFQAFRSRRLSFHTVLEKRAISKVFHTQPTRNVARVF